MTSDKSFDELLGRCTAVLGVPEGGRTRESLRRVIRAWTEERIREDGKPKVSVTDSIAFFS